MWSRYFGLPFFMCVDNGGEEREVFKRRGEGNGGVEPHHMQSLGHMEMPVTERWSLLACLPSWIYTNGIKDGGGGGVMCVLLHLPNGEGMLCVHRPNAVK